MSKSPRLRSSVAWCSPFSEVTIIDAKEGQLFFVFWCLLLFFCLFVCVFFFLSFGCSVFFFEGWMSKRHRIWGDEADQPSYYGFVMVSRYSLRYLVEAFRCPVAVGLISFNGLFWEVLWLRP